MASMLSEAAIFLGSAVITVPLFKKIGLGSVLGYLTAGVLIGPNILGLISDVEDILHFAEFGVVLLLFIIGLELQPKKLWEMRRSVFGIGGSQVLITGIVLSGITLAFGFPLNKSLVAGFSLALSSTAFGIQLLSEKNELTKVHGQKSFAVLLFQDIAVVPLIAIVPLLGVAASSASDASTTDTILDFLKTIGVILAVIIAGRYMLKPIFKMVANTHLHELFTGAALFVVLAMALLMDAVGLSMALGSFMAGVLLADSEYRHELEAEIEPFKGLLLGLFFIAVGMSVKFSTIAEQPLVIIGLALLLTVIKFIILYALAIKAGLDTRGRLIMATSLSQGGEFGFVLFTVATTSGAMLAENAEILVMVVTLSMALTPFLYMFMERVILPRLEQQDSDREFDNVAIQEPRVIIAGFGRFGQIIARVLRARKIAFTALEVNANQVDFVRRFGNQVFYGDASRLELLRAAKADQAEIIVVALQNIEASLRTVETVKKHFPHLKIYARARNRIHAYKLIEAGVEHLIRDFLLSSADMATNILESLGLSYSDAHRTVERFIEHDEQVVREQAGVYRDVDKWTESAKESAKRLENLFQSDSETPLSN